MAKYNQSKKTKLSYNNVNNHKAEISSINLLGIQISSTSITQLLNFVKLSLKNKDKFFITTPNPEILVLAQSDAQLKSALNASDVALPDGVGITLATKLYRLGNITRIPGRIAVNKLLSLANEKSYKIFILGSTQSINLKSIQKIKSIYKNIDTQGDWGLMLNNNASPATKRDAVLQKDILDKINKFKPDILFVAFGAPKQEKWVYKNFNNLNIGGAMVVGGSFDYFAGNAKLPPLVISRLGLEWLWRLLLEPKRLKRILNATIKFPLLVLTRQHRH